MPPCYLKLHEEGEVKFHHVIEYESHLKSLKLHYIKHIVLISRSIGFFVDTCSSIVLQNKLVNNITTVITELVNNITTVITDITDYNSLPVRLGNLKVYFCVVVCCVITYYICVVQLCMFLNMCVCNFVCDWPPH